MYEEEAIGEYRAHTHSEKKNPPQIYSETQNDQSIKATGAVADIYMTKNKIQF